jgi:malate dehydrogenase (oxaloacetate-decarboxylating)(NADP+)
LGPEWKVLSRAEQANVDLTGVEVMEVSSNERFEELAKCLWEDRCRKGFTLQKARQQLRRPTWFGCMLVKEGIADGLVGGLMTPYADTVRPALTILGRNPDVLAASGVYVMLMKQRTMFFGDCTVNVDPDAETLAQIAINTAGVARSFGVEPRVAMLSFSDFGDHREMSEVAKVRRAIEIIREREPKLVLDGEVQADTAVNPDRAEELFPFSPLKGRANVLIFPNLSAGNISYKLLSELGGATAIGPLLVGINKPVNALALGSDVKDIVNIAALTVTQAIKQGK